MSKPQELEISRERVLSAWEDLEALAKAAEKPRLLANCAPARERMELGLFRLVVMGEIKKGKSSFINGLIGHDGLLPVDSDIATSTVFKVIHGPEKVFKVFFNPDHESGKKPQPLPIDPSDLSEYGTEGGNPGNIKNVDFIGIEVPCPLLKDGLVLVDTPGVGGLYKAHRDVTWKYAPNADAVLFVLDSVETVISQDEILFLRELLGKITKRVFFVQTKIDAAGTEQAQAWKARNLDVLSKELNLPRAGIQYFSVSSKIKGVAERRNSIKHLNESGFPAVLDFLRNNLMRDKQKHLAKTLACQLEMNTRQLGADFVERKKIITAGQQANLEAVKKEYEDARAALDTWQRVECPKEMRQFQRNLVELRRITRGKISEELDPTGPITNRMLGDIQKSDLTPEKINQLLRDFQQTCVSAACETTRAIHMDFNMAAHTLLVDTILRMGKGLNSTSLETSGSETEANQSSNLSNITLQDSLPISDSSIMGLARDTTMGAGLGYSIFHAAAIATSFIFPPATMAIGIASILGGVLGMTWQLQASENKRREEVLMKLRQILQDLMRKTQRTAMEQFDKAADRFEWGTEEQIQKAVSNYKEQLETKLRQVNEAKSKTAIQFKEEMDSIGALEKRLERVIAKLKAFHPSPAPNPK